MYSVLWSPRLRQGDIVGPLFLPTLGKNIKTVVGATSLTKTPGDQEHKVVLVEGGYHHLAIVSHCCEFNENKRNKFLVARLQTRPNNLTKEEEAALRESNDVAARSEAGQPVAGVDTFMLDPIPGKFESPQVAAFTSITAMPMSWAADFLDAKVAELEHSTRVLFRKKLAWFYGRDSEDIPDNEKSEPLRPGPTDV